MLLIVGLGNPGRRYAGHRHNIGFLAADEIHRRHHFSPWRARFQGELSEGLLGGEKAFVLKPATFMNESGRSVGEAMRFHKLSPGDIVVIHDELDLPPGKARMKIGGGHGGHNGLKSIEAHIGKDFRRLRLGIGHPGSRELVNGYVLHDFAKSDSAWLTPLVEAVGDNAPLLAGGQDASFMNRVHLALSQNDEPDEPERALPRLPAGKTGHVGTALAAGLRKLLGRPE